jgi:hypothetical protein
MKEEDWSDGDIWTAKNFTYMIGQHEYRHATNFGSIYNNYKQQGKLPTLIEGDWTTWYDDESEACKAASAAVYKAFAEMLDKLENAMYADQAAMVFAHHDWEYPTLPGSAQIADPNNHGDHKFGD